MALLGVVTLVASLGLAGQAGAGASPTEAPAPPTVAGWSNAGWKKDAGLSGGADALGTVLIDWEAVAEAKVGDTFELDMPSQITGDPADPAEVELVDDQGYLGATGLWDETRDSIEFTLEQPGTVADDSDPENTLLLGGTFTFDVVWDAELLEAGTLRSGEQTLRFSGPGFAFDAGHTELFAQYEAADSEEVDEEGQPAEADTPVKKTPQATAPEPASTQWEKLDWSAQGLSGNAEATAALGFEWSFAPDAEAGTEITFELPVELMGVRAAGDEVLEDFPLLDTAGAQVGVAQWNTDADQLTLTLEKPATPAAEPEVEPAAQTETEAETAAAEVEPRAVAATPVSAAAAAGTQKVNVGWTPEALESLSVGKHELTFGGSGTGTLKVELTEPGEEASSFRMANTMMARQVGLDICENPTMWGSNNEEMIVEYTTAGVPTGREITMLNTVSMEGYDIAIEPDGEIMWAVAGGGKLDAYSVSTGEHLQRFTLGSSVLGAVNSLSFTGDTLLYGTSNSPRVMAVTDLPVPVAGGPDVTLEAHQYLSGGSLVPWGWAGDFITLADGSLLGLASNYNLFGIPYGGTRLIMFDKLPDGGFAAPRHVGEAVTPSGGKLSSYGGTFVSGSLYFAEAAGQWYRLDEMPHNGTSSTKFRTTLVVSGLSNFLGATSIQESNAICSSPDVSVTKTAGQVSGPDGNGDYTASYSVTVTNDGFAGGTYAALTDTPVFDPNLQIKGASWTGEASGSQEGPGPFLIDNRNVNIGGGASKSYEVSVRFSYAEGVYDTASNCGTVPTEYRGLTNIIGVSGSSEITPDTVACLEPPAAPEQSLVSLSWSKVAAGTSDRLEGSQWSLVTVDGDNEPTDDFELLGITDCVAATALGCAGQADTNPAMGEFTVDQLLPGLYGLIETQAPVGYLLDDQVRPISLVTASSLGEIENTQRNVLLIPLTGGTGAQMFLLGGVLLVVAAGAAVAVRSRMQRSQETGVMTIE